MRNPISLPLSVSCVALSPNSFLPARAGSSKMARGPVAWEAIPKDPKGTFASEIGDGWVV